MLEIDYIIFNIRRKNLENLPKNYFYEFGTYNVLSKKIEVNSEDDIIFTWKTKDYCNISSIPIICITKHFIQ